MSIRIVVAENHPITRMGIRKLLEVEQDVELVGETETVEEALKLVEELDPDVLVTGLLLGGKGDGKELCEQVKSMSDAPRVIFHTAYNSTEELLSCRLSEADGYVHKSEEPKKLLEAVRSVWLTEHKWYIGQEPEEPDARLREALEWDVLTPREREIFELLRRRRIDKEISEDLNIGLETVKTHVSNVLHKLGYECRLDIS